MKTPDTTPLPKVPHLRARSLLAAAFLLVAGSPAANADLLVYEGFNGYADGNLGGQTVTNTTGLTGAYVTIANNIPVSSTGLTFGNLEVSGGKVEKIDTLNTALGVALANDVAATGTLYSSYLISLSGANNGTIGLRTNRSASASYASAYFRTMGSPGNPEVTYSSTAGAGTSLPLDTYIVIAEFTNVGISLSTGVPGVATQWVLSLDQFNNFEAGGFSVAELNAADIGNGASNVTSRATASATSSTFTFSGASGNGIQINVLKAQPGTYALDEIRFGTTLSDVLPVSVPEPSTGLLLLGGIMAVYLTFRGPFSTKPQI